MSTSYRGKRSKYQHNHIWIIPLVSIVLLFLGISCFYKYQREHFRNNTIIHETDCSGMTVEEAFEQINKYLQNREITYIFADNTLIDKENLSNVRLEQTYELQAILNNQNNGDETRIFSLSDIFIDEMKVKEFMQVLPCFEKENIRQPQDAYLQLGNNNRFYIEPETYGNELNFDEALELALASLKGGCTTVDFRPITNSIPEIVSTDDNLVSQRDDFNSILDSVITYSLPDGTTFTLNSETIKTWFFKDENGIYTIDLDANIKAFVEELSKKVTESSSSVEFPCTDLGNITLSVPKAFKATVDSEAEFTKIKTELGSNVTRTPIYSKSMLAFDEHSSYVEIDTTRQTVWMYYEGTCIVDTPCVTGNYPNHHTPSGIFKLTYKQEDRYLQGYNDDGSRYKSYVNYWMPFNGGIGLHDATWRNKFGGQIYKGNGSHGCINLPLKAARNIYENITADMPIIVYSS